MKSAAADGNFFRSRKIIIPVLLTVLICTLLSGLIARQKQPEKLRVDPFYLKLFDEAKQSFNRGDYENAFQSFRLAAFGFLDEPDLLGEALVYLTVTAYNLKKDDQVVYYLKEIMRFKLNNRISASSLPPDIKKKFEKIQADFKASSNG